MYAAVDEIILRSTWPDIMSQLASYIVSKLVLVTVTKIPTVLW